MDTIFDKRFHSFVSHKLTLQRNFYTSGVNFMLFNLSKNIFHLIVSLMKRLRLTLSHLTLYKRHSGENFRLEKISRSTVIRKDNISQKYRNKLFFQTNLSRIEE